MQLDGSLFECNGMGSACAVKTLQRKIMTQLGDAIYRYNYDEKGQVAVLKMLLVVSHSRFGNLSPVCTVSAVVDWNT